MKLPYLAPDKIPPRRWAYGNYLLVGEAGVLGAIDGGGKGAIAVAMALSVIFGRELLGERVWRTGRVAIVTYEDGFEEWRRRITAACIHYGLDVHRALDSVVFIDRADGRVSFGELDGRTVIFPDSEAIIATLREIGAVLLIVDPLNHAHGVDDGNSNALMAKVSGEMTRVARAADVAVLVLHHVRKGSTGAADDLMGATSIRATFRSCRILVRMDQTQAKGMNIKDPWRYSRIAGSKENYAPPPDRSKWFKLESVELGNSTDEYRAGDNIGVATTWQPRSAFEGMDADTLEKVFAAFAKPHAATGQTKCFPPATDPLTKLGGRNQAEAKKIIETWVLNGVLVEGDHYNEKRRRDVRALTLGPPAGEILASLRNDITLSDAD